MKLIWTVERKSVLKFREHYKPSCDMIFVQIVWNDTGGLFYIPVEVQNKIFDEIGKDRYIKLPKPGTNPRGVEFSANAFNELVNNKDSYKIPIKWDRDIIEFNSFNRWVELWQQD